MSEDGIAVFPGGLAALWLMALGGIGHVDAHLDPAGREGAR